MLGEKSYASLAELPVKPDVVNVFRVPAQIPAIVDEMLALGLKNLWVQQGIVNLEAAKRAEAGRDSGGDGSVHYGGAPEETVVSCSCQFVSLSAELSDNARQSDELQLREVRIRRTDLAVLLAVLRRGCRGDARACADCGGGRRRAGAGEGAASDGGAGRRWGRRLRRAGRRRWGWC